MRRCSYVIEHVLTSIDDCARKTITVAFSFDQSIAYLLIFSIDMTRLAVSFFFKTVLFQAVHFCISTQFKYQNSSISSNSV